MGLTRVFYGHEGVVPPTGLTRSAARAPRPAEAAPSPGVIETVPGTEDQPPVVITGEPIENETEALAPAALGIPATVERPDSSWTNDEIAEFAAQYNIDLSGLKKKSAKLAAIDAAFHEGE